MREITINVLLMLEGACIHMLLGEWIRNRAFQRNVLEKLNHLVAKADMRLR